MKGRRSRRTTNTRHLKLSSYAGFVVQIPEGSRALLYSTFSNPQILLKTPKFETSTDTDMQLLARFEQSRDQSAFAELVRRHGPMVMAAAMRELGNRDDAEDAPNPTSIRVTKSVIGWRCPARVLGFTCTSSLTFS